jgi:hypothetical protein
VSVVVLPLPSVLVVSSRVPLVVLGCSSVSDVSVVPVNLLVAARVPCW